MAVSADSAFVRVPDEAKRGLVVKVPTGAGICWRKVRWRDMAPAAMVGTFSRGNRNGLGVFFVNVVEHAVVHPNRNAVRHRMILDRGASGFRNVDEGMPLKAL